MKKRTGRMIDAAVTAARGEFLDLPSFPCKGIKEGPDEMLIDEDGVPHHKISHEPTPLSDLCVCGEPLTELGCLEHEDDTDQNGIGVDVSDLIEFEDDL